MFFLNTFNMPRTFNKRYTVFCASRLRGNKGEDVEVGGKIIMPPSALHELSQINTTYPLLFKLTNGEKKRTSHCGVLEFTSEEDRVYMPQWMMQNLLLDEGDSVSAKTTSLPVGTFARFQPQSTLFLDINNPKAVLENSLRTFTCLSEGDTIGIRYNNKNYDLLVLETKPKSAVCIIECDINVEFSAPPGYEECESTENSCSEYENTSPGNKQFVPFSGQGNIIDEKKKKKIQLQNSSSKSSQPSVVEKSYERGVPDYDYTIGTLTFMRNTRPSSKKGPEDSNDNFMPFSGPGQALQKTN